MTNLKDDPYLLDRLVKDAKKQSGIYQPGPYWRSKTKVAINEIKQYGLKNFRGSDNLIGMAFADCNHIDIRNSLNYGVRKIMRSLVSCFPFNRVFDAQVAWTESYSKQLIQVQDELLNLKPRTNELLKNYNLPYSLLGGCERTVRAYGGLCSTYYLSLLDRHDVFAQHIDFKKVRSVFEIGGGFGANIHILLENYPNIRKVLYLDIPPNLYVGTQYLKSFYGDYIFDYGRLKAWNTTSFSENDELEIFCIAPWQIEKFKDHIDLFANSNSFVEMPSAVVQNYVNHINDDTVIALSSYSNYDLSTTLSPYQLPDYFKCRKFEIFDKETLLNSNLKDIYLVSNSV